MTVGRCPLALALLLLAGSASAANVIASNDGEASITVHERFPRGEGPFPAMVLLHGCDGGARSHYGWAGLKRHADYLNGLGIAALLVDSFALRDVGPVESCTNSGRYVLPRVHDAFAALRYLQRDPRVIDDAIGVQGASQGGGVVLRAVAWSGPSAGRSPGPGFAAGIAFYPWCDPSSPPPPPRVPLLILSGGEDDWTPAEYCESFVARHADAEPAPRIVVLAGAEHSFDLPGLPRQQFMGHTVAGDRQAYLAARRHQREFLQRHLLPESSAAR